MLISPQVVLTN